MLKASTSDSRKDWFAVGAYKRLPNEVGGCATCPPGQVHERMAGLLAAYNACPRPSLADLLDFHVRFERIHPFQDGNGRVGRLILFKECLAAGLVPFIITEELKMFYYRGLAHWGSTNGYLLDTCLAAQDRYKELLDYFRIPYCPPPCSPAFGECILRGGFPLPLFPDSSAAFSGKRQAAFPA